MRRFVCSLVGHRWEPWLAYDWMRFDEGDPWLVLGHARRCRIGDHIEFSREDDRVDQAHPIHGHVSYAIGLPDAVMTAILQGYTDRLLRRLDRQIRVGRG